MTLHVWGKEKKSCRLQGDLIQQTTFWEMLVRPWWEVMRNYYVCGEQGGDEAQSPPWRVARIQQEGHGGAERRMPACLLLSACWPRRTGEQERPGIGAAALTCGWRKPELPGGQGWWLGERWPDPPTPSLWAETSPLESRLTNPS